MTVLENAVVDLANALQKLETKLETKVYDQTSGEDDLNAARRHARAARGHASEAGRILGRSIDDLKSLVESTAVKAEDASDGES